MLSKAKHLNIEILRPFGPQNDNLIDFTSLSSTPAAEDAQQEQKHIDKIKVKP